VPELARYLAKRCTGGHPHGQLIGGKAKAAEEYPPGLVDAILRGLRTALARHGSLHVPRDGKSLYPVTAAEAKRGNEIGKGMAETTAR